MSSLCNFPLIGYPYVCPASISRRVMAFAGELRGHVASCICGKRSSSSISTGSPKMLSYLQGLMIVECSILLYNLSESNDSLWLAAAVIIDFNAFNKRPQEKPIILSMGNTNTQFSGSRCTVRALCCSCHAF